MSRRQLENYLAEVDELEKGKQWIEARVRLQELDQRYPNNAEILGELLNVAYELHDMRAYLDADERWLKLDPNHADLTLALAGAYLGNLRPASALATFHRFLQRFPQHERATEARQEMTELEAKMSDMLRDLGVAGDAGLEIAILHERILGLLDQGRYSLHLRQCFSTVRMLNRVNSFCKLRNLPRHPNCLPPCAILA